LAKILDIGWDSLIGFVGFYLREHSQERAIGCEHGLAGISTNDSNFTSGNVPAPFGQQVGIIQSSGSMAQTSSVTGGTYTLSFWVSQRLGDSVPQSLLVSVQPYPLNLSVQNFVWCGNTICEERDATGSTVTKRFFAEGEQRIGDTDPNYYFTRDQLGSVREVTNSSGVLVSQFDYDPWGNRAGIAGNMNLDFGFTGHYYHENSGLNLAMYRAYNPSLGRWISRDPIGENGGLNLYGYVGNDPIDSFDPFGLFSCDELRAMLAHQMDSLRGATDDANDLQTQLASIGNASELRAALLRSSTVLAGGATALSGFPLFGFAGLGSTPWVVGTASTTTTTTVMTSSYLFLSRTGSTLRNTILTSKYAGVPLFVGRKLVTYGDHRLPDQTRDAGAALDTAMDARQEALDAAQAIMAAMSDCGCK
jgi:RHS repeat-associated protein